MFDLYVLGCIKAHFTCGSGSKQIGPTFRTTSRCFLIPSHWFLTGCTKNAIINLNTENRVQPQNCSLMVHIGPSSPTLGQTVNFIYSWVQDRRHAGKLRLAGRPCRQIEPSWQMTMPADLFYFFFLRIL